MYVIQAVFLNTFWLLRCSNLLGFCYSKIFSPVFFQIPFFTDLATQILI